MDQKDNETLEQKVGKQCINLVVAGEASHQICASDGEPRQFLGTANRRVAMTS